MALLCFLLYLCFSLIVLYKGLNSPFWEIGSALYLLLALFIGPSWPLLLLIAILIVSIITLIHSQRLRQSIANKLFIYAAKSVPKLSSTEEEALNAGDVWLERDIFVGAPNWKNLEAVSAELSDEETAFLENETASLCAMLDDWAINQEGDLPQAVWTFIKEKGFFGLVIAKEYGGKGFSARAHSEIVMKIASRSGVAAVTIMVPNSLGPGELLHYYGTPEQKQRYLPRLAKGLDIPCFALTEPNAGSDAVSLQTEAIVCEKIIAGRKTLGLEINHLNKRWITLAPIATLIGLAVQLKDPNHLLGENALEGITCLLIPRDTQGLEIGNRHLPAFQPFMNGTIRGENLFVPIDSIIGGISKAGRGWQMLVECLSIGRSISLPALAASSSAIAYISSGAFARVRKQFNVEIAQFEGIEEKLAEIAGLNYLINSTRLLTVAAVNQHKKPSVASAITKYFNTELSRITVNAAMDIHGGRGVVVGPRNYLTSCYLGLPIAITVEGANIMSRNLLIFGQGSMACHPFIREEFYAISRNDKKAFSDVLWKHIRYFITNFAKTICSAWTGGYFIEVPENALSREYQRLTRLSQAFAWIADLSLIYLGGELKRKERISARLADGLSYLYMAMAALHYYQKAGCTEDLACHTRWAVRYCFYHAQKALLSVGRNFPSRLLGVLMRIVAFPLGQTMTYPSDKLDHKLAQLMSTNNQYREALKNGIYLSPNANQALDKMEETLQLILQNSELIEKAKPLRRFSFKRLKEQLKKPENELNFSQEEQARLIAVERARWDAIQVDEFSFDTLKQKIFHSITDNYANPLDDKLQK